MRKLTLTALALFARILCIHAQSDTAAYQSRKLRLDEVNFVSGYYMQDGNNSAVTGGIGTEKLTDFANTIELKMIRTDTKGRAHTGAFELGIDNYTSASSDNIDPTTISSASRGDTRIYPSLSYTISNNQTGLAYGAALSYSTEYDYQSFGLGVNLAKTSKDKNRELGLKLQAYLDTWQVIYPIELRPGHGNPDAEADEGGWAPRNSYSASLSYSQVINKRLQLAFLADGIYQQGLLATKYQRVYFTDNSEHTETLPDTRFKLPLGIRASYFAGNRVVVRGYYRYYFDNWGVLAHTLNLELPIKITPFLSVSPYYRYYTQSAANYFAPYHAHSRTESYYTSDYDLSAFNSHFAGTGFRYIPEKGVLGIRRWASAEIRYGHYIRSTGLTSNIISLNATFK
jgi:hypothetical protein